MKFFFGSCITKLAAWKRRKSFGFHYSRNYSAGYKKNATNVCLKCSINSFLAYARLCVPKEFAAGIFGREVERRREIYCLRGASGPDPVLLLPFRLLSKCTKAKGRGWPTATKKPSGGKEIYSRGTVIYWIAFGHGDSRFAGPIESSLAPASFDLRNN